MKLCPHCGFDLVKDEPIESRGYNWSPDTGLSYKGEPLVMRAGCHEIAGALMKARGRVLSHDALLNRLGSDADAKHITQLLCHLRAAMRKSGGPAAVKSVYGKGTYWSETSKLPWRYSPTRQGS